jgi:hypothetical protein
MCPVAQVLGLQWGVVAFFLLMLVELGLSVLAFERSAAQFAKAYGTVPGMIGLAAQIVFAAFPVLHVWGRDSRSYRDQVPESGMRGHNHTCPLAINISTLITTRPPDSN